MFIEGKTVVDIGRVITGHNKGSRMPYLLITDGRKQQLSGLCVYFLRDNNETKINIRNVGEVNNY